MSRNDPKWFPERADHVYIETIAAPPHPTLLAIEAAAVPEGIPILDRASGRVLGILAGARRRIVEVGTAYGYSTLCLALGQPEDGRIVTIDPDRARTAIARRFWREAGIADERIEVVSRPALEAFDDGEPSLAGPFDLAFIDALKGEYAAYVEAVIPRLAPGAFVVADNTLWSGRVSGARPTRPNDNTDVLRAFDAGLLRDPRFDSTILPVGDGLLVATYRGLGG